VGEQAPSPVRTDPAPIAAKSPAPIIPKPQTSAASKPPVVVQPPPAAPSDSPLVAAAKRHPSQTLTDAPFQLVEAQQYLNEGKLLAARQIYLRLAQNDGLPRTTLLAVARGLNQTSAWRESSTTYQKVMPFRTGEEMHEFYEAVNFYELGQTAAARELLARALPSLPLTRETSLYKAKILGVQ
jgi:hypothetical protein